jgi:DNA ligase-1
MKRLVALFLVVACLAFAKKPELFLLQVYQGNTPLDGWVMSEKLDGVRAYWDGKKLQTRNGNTINAPTFFTKDFPPFELDGELWSKRGDFATISSIVNTQEINETRWRKLSYNVFEVPHADGNLTQRLSKVHATRYLKVIPQIAIANKEALEDFFHKVVKGGGEGVVLRDARVAYYTGRLQSGLKYKPYDDAECVVVGYFFQKKERSLLASLACQLENGDVIKIGTGFSKEQRKNPPKIGSVITFKHYGLTRHNKPRFAVFLRVRRVAP